MRRLPLLRLIWLGPSLTAMRATEDSGTTVPSGATTGRAASCAGSLRSASSSRITTSKRRSPSKILPAAVPVSYTHLDVYKRQEDNAKAAQNLRCIGVCKRGCIVARHVSFHGI